jgi:hypothetical protein
LRPAGTAVGRATLISCRCCADRREPRFVRLCRARRSDRRSLDRSRVFATFAPSTQPRLAWSMPHRMKRSSDVECASVFTMNRAPNDAARRHAANTAPDVDAHSAPTFTHRLWPECVQRYQTEDA